VGKKEGEEGNGSVREEFLAAEDPDPLSVLGPLWGRLEKN